MAIEVVEMVDKLSSTCFTPGRPEPFTLMGKSDPVLLVVAHNTCGPDDTNQPGADPASARALGDAAAAYLCNNERNVSAHYLIGPEAAPVLYHIVHEYDTAYHCGGNPPTYPSHWVDPDTSAIYTGFGLNQVSIGVEVFGQATDTLGPNQTAMLRYLFFAYAGGGIFSRHLNLIDELRIVSHKRLERGDRTDGPNWVNVVRGWVG